MRNSRDGLMALFSNQERVIEQDRKKRLRTNVKTNAQNHDLCTEGAALW